MGQEISDIDTFMSHKCINSNANLCAFICHLRPAVFKSTFTLIGTALICSYHETPSTSRELTKPPMPIEIFSPASLLNNRAYGRPT